MIMDCWGGAKIRCEFSKTQINTDNIVLKTIFHSVTDSTLYIKPETIRKEVEQAFFDAATVLTDFSIKDTVKLDKPYTYLYVNPSGKVMAVIDDKGKIKTEETTISATSLKENTLIQGKNGEELVLTKKGQVMGKNEFNATGGNSVLLKEYHRKSDSLAQWQINFISAKKQQVYAFDQIGSGNHGIFSGADYYPQVGSYDFRYKSVECGKNDKVIVEFDTYPQADSVVFKDKYGVTYPISLTDNVLSFTGVSKADTNYIYAYRGDQKIGKLFLNTYQQKTYKVVLVSVNGAKLPNTKKLEDYINKVYKQCAVSIEIATDTLSIKKLFPFSHGDKNRFSGYNDDQKKVLQAFDSRIQPDVNYLFFIPDGAETNGVAGYKPLGYNFGFIYYGAGDRTIAHELSHGIASLHHPFTENQVSGNTDNLMDYNDGLSLWHYQWDNLQNPPNRIFKWRFEEKDAEEIIVDTVYYLKIVDTNTKYPTDKTIDIESYLGKSYEFQLVKGDSIYSCDWKFQNTEEKEAISFYVDISLPKTDTLFVSKNNTLLAKYCINITQFDDYKIKIEELEKYFSSNDSLLLPTEPDSLIHIVYVRGDDPIECTWYFNSNITHNLSSYSLPIDKALSDTLRVYWKDTLLLVTLKIDIKDLPYVFKIRDTKIQALSGTEMYVVQQDKKLDLHLFRGDNEVKATWKGLKVSNKSFVTLDFSKTDNKKIQVVNANNKVFATLKLNIYKKSEVEFDLLPSYQGEFGFDNSMIKYKRRKKYIEFAEPQYSKYKYPYLTTTKYMPIMTIQPKQTASLNVSVNVAKQFYQNDSSAYIKFVSSNSDLVVDLLTSSTNILTHTDLNTTSSNIVIEIVAKKSMSNCERIYALDNANDTIGQLAVFCKDITQQKKKLHIYYLSDNSLPPIAYNVDTLYFKEKSYNQAFINWSFDIKSYKFKSDILKRISKTNNDNNWKELADTVYTELKNKGIEIRSPKSNDYYLFIVPIYNFSFKYTNSDGKDESGTFLGFCDSKNLTRSDFFHDVFISSGGCDSQICVHEIGHTFRLTHIFDRPLNLKKGKTNNYMDYSGPKKMKCFWFFQWRMLNSKDIPY